MTNEEKNKLFEIRCQSKLGKGITKKETKFIQKMYEKYPDEYSAMNKEVFEATKPFGSTTEYKEPKI
jgi:hypothetical protein